MELLWLVRDIVDPVVDRIRLVCLVAKAAML